MIRRITYQKRPKGSLPVDVRTAAEFERGHIPGAVNLPIFDEKERHEIGLLYKQSSKEEAKRAGIQYMSARLPAYYDRVMALLESHRPLLFYCARGGMRSGSIGGLLASLGHPVLIMEGGFKAYRRLVLDTFDSHGFFDRSFVMLHGHTGVGKTEILEELARRGEQVLDLEALADHRGSLLGGIGREPLTSQMQYENMIFEELAGFGPGPVYLESESRRVGMVTVPKPLFDVMGEGQHVLIEDTMARRAERLVADYTATADFEASVEPILERLGTYHSHQMRKELRELLSARDHLALAAFLMEEHYDPLYKKSERTYTYDATIAHQDTKAVADQLQVLFPKQ